MATYGITFYAFDAEGVIVEHHEVSPYEFVFVCEDELDLKEAAEAAQVTLGFSLETYVNEVFRVLEVEGTWMELRCHDLGTYWTPWAPWEG